MKFQALLTTLYYLLFSSSAKQINDTLKGVRETRAPKSTTIYHNGHPIQVHEIPQQSPIFQEIQTLASNVAPSKVENGPPKVALQRDKVVIKNENTYLQDSYGNRYYSPPQQLAYKAIFPQQFVALQDLPTHFSQPLLGPTQSKQAYTLPHFSFSEQVGRPIQLHSDHSFFNFPKTAHSIPLTLPPQRLNIPTQNHYKFGDAVQFVSGNHQAPVTFSYHKSPAQRFINFAPDQHIHHKSAPILHTSTQSTNNVVSQKIQSEQDQQQPRETSESRTSPAKQQHPKQFEQKPIKVLQEMKTIDPQYFEPQVFANPIVPQVQHYLPKIQSVLRYNIFPRPQVPVAEIKIEQTEQEQERTPQKHEGRPNHYKEKSQPHQDNSQYHQEKQHQEKQHQEKQQHRQERPKHQQEKPHPQDKQPQEHQERRAQHSERRPQFDSLFEHQIKEIVSRPENNNIIINEYNSPEKHELKEEVKAEVIDEEENEEKNFNDGYHEAAKGFPAYSYNDDYEKKIFDEASYGEPQYHDSLPFISSEESFPSDPEEKRSKYIISGSLHHNTYGEDQSKEFKPIPYNDGKKYFSTLEKKPSSKWSKQQTERYKYPKSSGKHEYREYEVPFHFETSHQQHTGGNKQKSPSKSARFEIDYSKGYSLPHAARHSQEYQGNSRKHAEGPSARFVEPQYHYGFEPIFESRQDSEEQASSASNVAPEREVRPSTMKKVYKENWFISKTSSAEADS